MQANGHPPYPVPLPGAESRRAVFGHQNLLVRASGRRVTADGSREQIQPGIAQQVRLT